MALLLWRVIAARAVQPAPLALAVHRNLLTAFQDGEIVRGTAVLEAGTQRGQFQTVEAERRRGAEAVGVLSNPQGVPPYAWLVGARPSFSLDVLQPQDRQLSVQLSNGTSRPQPVSLLFNGREVATGELPVLDLAAGSGAVTLLADVPATLQRRGGNRVELGFGHTEPRRLMGEPVALPLAAVLTTVRFAAPGQLNEPLLAPPRAGLVTVSEGGQARSALEVPPGTSARVALDLPEAERVVLRFHLSAIGVPTEVSVLTDEGRRTRLHTFQPNDPVPVEASYDLSAWAGKPLLLDVWARDGEGPALLMESAAILVPRGQAQVHELPPAETVPPERTPSFLVVTLDALARRWISAQAGGRSCTPNLDALMERAVRFTSATAPASYTLASVASMLTGQDPQTHRVVEVEDARGVRRLAEVAPRLPRLLAERGWRTAAFVTNPNAGARHGFGEGFERYDELFADPALWDEGVAGAHLVPRLSGWLAEIGADPFLAWVHVFEPHAPYDAPPDLLERIVGDYDGSVAGTREWIDAYKLGEAQADEAGWRHLRELYAARVALADRVLGELLAVLQASGRAGDTVIAVVSDHGESLGQHGAVEHGDLVYGHQLDVAWVLAVPGRSPAKLGGPASLTDLAPTLLRLAGIEAPAAMDGVDLLSPQNDPGRGLLARSSARLPVLSWTRDGMRLIVDSATRRRELYDLRRDPQELSDLLERRPATAALLYQELCRAVCEAEARGREAERGEPIDERQREQLAAIGYGGFGGAPAPRGPSLCERLRGPLRRL